MDEPILRRFEQLVGARTGLALRPRERAAFAVAIGARMAALSMRQADQYLQLLQTSSPAPDDEWDHLIAKLTNNESYFFRDNGQMTLLRERILPDLIARNGHQRTLRLWSAGCSTGEEAYSLAMLVDELLPQHRATTAAGWEVAILGTDVDGQAIHRANRGVYGAWSFRTMEPALQQRYFRRQGDSWQVAETTRTGVTFSRSNLVNDAFPNTTTGIHDMDLILCRNVFIYFERKAVAAVLPKFVQTLREGGYLMTGHAEIQGLSVKPLRARVFPKSVVYQRSNSNAIAVDASAGPAQFETTTEGSASQSAPAARRTTDRQSAEAASDLAPSITADAALAAAQALYLASDYQGVIRTLQSPPNEPPREQTLLLLAQSHANLGQHEAAIACCEALIEACPFAAGPVELLASIAQEQGRYDQSKMLLKRALYLAPSAPASYLELGEIYRREGDITRARTMHVTALELLGQMPAQAAVGSYGGPTAHEWTLHLQQLISEGA